MVAPIAALALVYACSLTFVYVEGDDAASIAYHALGRDPSLQPAFSPYHGMMDLALSVLPAREPLLRGVAMGLSSLAAVVFVLLLLALVFDWLGEEGGGVAAKSQGWVALVVLAASPELFYLGLVYTPSVVATSLLLFVHLLLRRWRSAPPRRWVLVLSWLTFGIGAACRWDVTVYGAVIVADLAVSGWRVERRRWRALAGAATWGGGALTAAIGAIWLSGSGPGVVWRYLTWSSEIAFGDAPLTTHFGLATVLNVVSWASPAFVLLVAVGLGGLVVRRSPLVIVVLVGVLLILPWASSGIAKLMLAGVPGLSACLAWGFLTLWEVNRRRWLAIGVRAAVVGVLAGPWLVGVRVHDPEISWGPGFGMRDYATSSAPAAASGALDFGRRRVWPVLGAGLAIPGSEGPRPVGGHAAVLVGGGWRALVRAAHDEREQVLNLARERRLPILHDRGEGYAVTHLAAMGFLTTDPAAAIRRDEEGPVARVFRRPEGEELLVLRCRDRRSLTAGGEELERLDEISGGTVVIYGYGATLRALHALAPAALEPLGPSSAVVDLGRLRQAIARSVR